MLTTLVDFLKKLRSRRYKMDDHEQEVSDADDISVNNLNYDNCLIQNHGDTDDSLTSSTINLELLSDEQTTLEVNAVEAEEDNGGISNISDMSVKESFVLMIAFLHRLDRYFNGQGETKEDLFKKMVVLKRLLTDLGADLGFDEFKDAAALGEPKDGGNNSNKQSLQQPEKSTEHQVNDTLEEQEEMNQSVNTNSATTKLQNTSTNSKQSQRKGIKNSIKGQKRKRSLPNGTLNKDASTSKRASKRTRITYSSYDERLMHTAAKVRASLTGENIETLTRNLVQQSLTEKVNGRTKNSATKNKLSCTTSAVENGTSNKVLTKRPKLSQSLNETDLAKERVNGMNRSLRRSLYSPESWIKKLPVVQ